MKILKKVSGFVNSDNGWNFVLTPEGWARREWKNCSPGYTLYSYFPLTIEDRECLSLLGGAFKENLVSIEKREEERVGIL